MAIERLPCGVAVGRCWAALACTLGLVLAAGCSVGPEYRRPIIDAPPAWSAAAALAAAGPDVASRPVAAAFDGRRWWQLFNDPLLNQLVDDAIAQNLDLQTATLRIASARAQRRQAGGAAYPQVAGNAVAARSRMSENGIAGVLGGGAGGGTGGGAGGDAGAGGSAGGAGASAEPAPSLTSNFFQAGFDATWEIDLFGGVRRNVQAAQANIAAAEEQRNDAQASLTAEIARSYFSLRGAEQRLAITRADLAAQRRLSELAASRWRAGLGSESEVLAQSAQLQSALAQLPPLQQELAQARNRLALLLALPPGALDARLARANAAMALPPEVPIGLPGDLLRRRPDVRRSEADLQAATARVGVAQAKLFPSITLGLAAGLQATTASSLSDWASRFALGGALVQIPIFQGGQLRAQVEVAGLDAQRSALAYRQAVLAAFHDADNALVAYGHEQRHAAALQGQLADAERSRVLAQARWQQGLAAFSDVLSAERQAHQSELALAQSKTAAATNLVALFKALGGGWDS